MESTFRVGDWVAYKSDPIFFGEIIKIVDSAIYIQLAQENPHFHEFADGQCCARSDSWILISSPRKLIQDNTEYYLAITE